MFTEENLEKAIGDLFEKEGYDCLQGNQVHRVKTEVLILEDLKTFLRSKYKQNSISEEEVSFLVTYLKNFTKLPLYDANKEISNLVSNGMILKRLDAKDKDFVVNFIDYEDASNNIFKFVNQVEVLENEMRIPDAVVYVNGMPLVVLEFKSAVRENATVFNAYDQLTNRYRRDIPTLFKYNAFCVISDGVNNKFGSFFAPYDFYYAWRKINPEDKDVDGIDSLYTMVKGLFNQTRLIEIIKDFTYFPDTNDKSLKVVSRYPQYYAAIKLHASIKKNIKPAGSGKGGTYFGATGSGKSLTMLFLTRKLMKDKDLQSPTIVLITDRTDLDDQMSGLFLNSKNYIGDEYVKNIESREHLKEELSNRASGGVFLTTIQKFVEDTSILSDRTNIICISDEAHRSQLNMEQSLSKTATEIIKKYGFAKYLHDSLPNATYVGFSGTPIDGTYEVFGEKVDEYTMSESVRDGITVRITYDGRANKVLLETEKLKEIEDYYKQALEDGASEYQVEESQKSTAVIENIIGDTNRLDAVANDIINHYENRVFEKATVKDKAMIVCMNRKIAFELYKKIVAKRPEWAQVRQHAVGEVLEKKEKDKIKPMPMINLVMTKNQDDKKELWDLLNFTPDKKELDRQFKTEKSNFKIAIVVDMWLTGFDVPSLDTMYIDKPLQRHTLIQTISRVNRVYPGKERGLIVDYFGFKTEMDLALAMFNNTDNNIFQKVDEAVKIVKDQLQLLDKIFHLFDSSAYFTGSPMQKLTCLKNASEYVQTTEELEKRFMSAVKRLKSAYNLCSYSEDITNEEKDKVYFYGGVRSIIFKLTKGDAPDVAQMNAKVRKLIEEAIKSEGVEELFKEEQEIDAREFDIFSKEYFEKVNSIPLPNTKIKILQKLLKDAIEEYKKVNRIKGMLFSERLQILVDKYNDRQDEKVYASQILNDLAEEYAKLLEDLKNDKDSFKEFGIDFVEKSFFDILEAVAVKYGFYDDYIKKFSLEHLKNLAKDIKAIVDDKSMYADWDKREDIKADLQVAIILKLADYKYPPSTNDDVFKEIFEQAKNFRKFMK